MASRIRINHIALESMFLPGGDIYDASQTIGKAIVFSTRRLVPKRTGALSRSIRLSRIGTNKKHGTNFRVYSNKEYALFVEAGTRPVITSTTPGKLLGPLPPYRGHPAARMAWVSGQRGRHYLERGLQIGLRSGLRAAQIRAAGRLP